MIALRVMLTLSWSGQWYSSIKEDVGMSVPQARFPEQSRREEDAKHVKKDHNTSQRR